MIVNTIMACNRLKLDFSLATMEERSNFLARYLESDGFVKKPPNEEELDMMGKYILWGKDTDGRSVKDLGIFLETRHQTWNNDRVDSLDELLEMPTFSETQIAELGSTQFRTKKEVFSRDDVLRQCDDPNLLQMFGELFDEIDKMELQIQLYELAHGKRTKEIRSSLLKKYSEEELCKMREKVSHWNQYRYLRARHILVEMRREQYTLRDTYRKTSYVVPSDHYNPESVFDFDVGVDVLPLGLMYNNDVCAQIFRTWRELVPANVSESMLPAISRLYWDKQKINKKIESAPSTSHFYFDFRNLEHVYTLLDQQSYIESCLPQQDAESNLSLLVDTLRFYISQANLTEVQHKILEMKLQKKKNSDIAQEINHKYNKTYTTNYISTIFRQRIIPRINDAARYHEKVVSNLFFPEEFKVCSGCGETILRDPDNFTRRSRSNDGFSARCKRCEKKARQGG